MTGSVRDSTLRRFCDALGDSPHSLDVTHADPGAVPLPARLALGDLAWASVAAAAIAAGRLTLDVVQVQTDPVRVAVAFQSDRHLRINGATPDVWSPFSGFWRTADGWVRTHGNYPHHAAALRRGLDLPTDAAPEDVARRLRALTSVDATTAVTAEDGLCVSVSPENPEADAALCERPAITVTRMTDASPAVRRFEDPGAPLRGIRVLDLTRVIAGPVATRTLALLGAEVLRIDPPRIPEPEWQHLDTGHGKRSALLDIAADAIRWRELLHSADVVVLGYRAEGLARLGLTPEALHAQHPRLVIARLTAWGSDAPARRGFDSLVQAASGISWIESADGERPGALPAQGLDHSAGYLLAAGICAALRRQSVEGGGWIVETSLRRMAAELLRLPRQTDTAHATISDVTAHLQTFTVDGDTVTTAAPAVAYLGGPTRFSAPRRWGSDPAEWTASPGGPATER